MSERLYLGGCHCGLVRFEVSAPEALEAIVCTCSICTMTGFIHLIVPKARVRFICGQERLSTYTFNTGVAQHTFCPQCGVKPLYVPRSNPDGYSVNVRCLEGVELADVKLEGFNGRAWEESFLHDTKLKGLA